LPLPKCAKGPKLVTKRGFQRVPKGVTGEAVWIDLAVMFTLTGSTKPRSAASRARARAADLIEPVV